MFVYNYSWRLIALTWPRLTFTFDHHHNHQIFLYWSKKYPLCLLDSAPVYLCELCRPVSGLPAWQALRSSVTGQLLVPRATTATRQNGAFSIVGPSTWNALPLEIRLLPKNKVRFAGCLKLICIAVIGLGAPLRRFLEGAPYKFLNEWMNV